MDIVVKGRHHLEVPDHFRLHVGEKLSRVERYDAKIIRLDVEISHERNPRQADRAQRVEITCRTKGPVVRAEACAADFYSAVDLALDKLQARLRRSADRRRVHHGTRTPVSLATAAAAPPTPAGGTSAGPAAAASLPESPDGDGPGPLLTAAPPADEERSARAGTAGLAADVDLDGRPFVVREKVHAAVPMDLDQALFEMELVGHDFFLFADSESGRPSVVYRRRGYDYGVIRLGQ